LSGVAAAFTRREDVETARFVFDAQRANRGDVAVIASRGRYRAGIITKIGRLNVTVTYTTATAIAEANDPRHPIGEPVRSRKADRFAAVAVRPARPETADPDRPGRVQRAGRDRLRRDRLPPPSSPPAGLAMPLTPTGA
jgi:hypothetical protein